MTGTIKGVIGAAGTSNPVGTVANSVGSGVLAGIGLVSLGIDSLGNNSLGLPVNIAKGIDKGLTSALQGAAQGLPGAVFGVLNAIIGGSSQSGPKPVSLTLDAQINLEGTSTSSGALPGGAISFWIPGTDMSADSTGFTPHYNKPFGVINFTGTKPKLTFNYTTTKGKAYDRVSYSYLPSAYLGIEAKVIFPALPNYSSYLSINPEVLNIADVTIEKQELVFSRNISVDNLTGQPTGLNITSNPTELVWNNYNYLAEKNCWDVPTGEICPFPDDVKFGIRFIIKVQPKDGTPATTIIKTLEADWSMEGLFGTITPNDTNTLDNIPMYYIYVYKYSNGGTAISREPLLSPSNTLTQIADADKRFYVFGSNLWERLVPIYENKYKSGNGYSYSRTSEYISPNPPIFWLEPNPREGLIPVYSIYQISYKRNLMGGTWRQSDSYHYLTTVYKSSGTTSTGFGRTTIENQGIVGYTYP